jgi:adenylate cyclase
VRSVAEGAAPVAHQRKLAAILCADIAGFSRLMGEDETATYDALARLRGAIDPLIAAHRGRIVSTAGDGLLADFASIVDALSCAVDMQEAAQRLNTMVPAGRRLELRIGVNLGDVIVAEDGDLYGDGVNIAARLETLAAPGGICLSQTVYDQVGNKLDLDYRPLGAHRVKNIAAPVRAYAIGGGAAASPKRLAARWRWLIGAGALVLLVAAGVGVWLFRHAAAPLSPAPPAAEQLAAVPSLATPARLAERISVAVLPFKNLSPDAGQDFFADGITEDIINALGRFSNLLIAAKSASFQFKGRNVSPEEAGRVLDVRYLLEGSVRRAGDRLRITVELTEAATGFHLWSNVYNAELKDIFAVQDEITERVVGATAVKLTRLERERVLRKPTANLAAYELVLRGRGGVSNPTRAANEESRALFQRAIELDPNYAAAYAALGWTHYETAVSGWTEFYDDEIKQAESLAQKALALNPATAIAYRLLGNVAVFRRDYERALTEIDRAVALNPSDAENILERGYILLWSGKPAEAIPWIEAALRFDATDSRAMLNLGVAKYFLGQYADAAAVLDRALAQAPGRAVEIHARAALAAAYAQLGKQQDSERERNAVARLSPFFSAERFAAQFGTPDARRDMLAGLKAAGFQ